MGYLHLLLLGFLVVLIRRCLTIVHLLEMICVLLHRGKPLSVSRLVMLEQTALALHTYLKIRSRIMSGLLLLELLLHLHLLHCIHSQWDKTSGSPCSIGTIVA
jgi:hypothetical protein